MRVLLHILFFMCLTLPVKAAETTAVVLNNKDLSCLALNIYHEARSQSFAGQLAVAQVVMNRVKDSRYPNTICEVVLQGPHSPSWKDKTRMWPIRHRCQFTWYCDGKSDKPTNKKAWIYSIALTRYFLARSMMIIDFTEGATHYHADYVDPSWARKKNYIKTVQIDTHKFYRWQG